MEGFCFGLSATCRYRRNAREEDGDGDNGGGDGLFNDLIRNTNDRMIDYKWRIYDNVEGSGRGLL